MTDTVKKLDQGAVELLKVTYEGHKGQSPVLGYLSETQQVKVVEAVERTQPFVALTPNEIELNREVQHRKFNPPCDDTPYRG